MENPFSSCSVLLCCCVADRATEVGGNARARVIATGDGGSARARVIATEDGDSAVDWLLYLALVLISSFLKSGAGPRVEYLLRSLCRGGVDKIVLVVNVGFTAKMHGSGDLLC